VVASKLSASEAEPATVYGEGNMAHRELTDAVVHSDGVVIDGMVTRTR